MKYRIIICLILLFVISKGGLGQDQKGTQEIVGDYLQVVLPAAALGSTIIWKDGKNATLDCLKSLAITYGVVHSLKRIINKPRPNGMNHAFPSGHTASAFAGAAFIQKRYGWKYGIPSYVLASYAGYTRVEALKHDYWDVAAGAAIGIASSYLFTKKYNPTDMNISYRRESDGHCIQWIIAI